MTKRKKVMIVIAIVLTAVCLHYHTHKIVNETKPIAQKNMSAKQSVELSDVTILPGNLFLFFIKN